MTVRIRPAAKADIPQIVRVSMAAFHPSTDIISARLFPAHIERTDTDAIEKWSTARKSARLDMNNSIVMVAVDDALDGQVVRYAMWFIPVPAGNDKTPLPRVVFDGIDRQALMELGQIMDEDARRSFGPEGSRNVWNLDSLGVEPQHQKRGIGKMLLSWGVQQARKHGKACYLVATPSGLPLYQGAGFKTSRTVEIFGVLHVSMVMEPSVDQDEAVLADSTHGRPRTM